MRRIDEFQKHLSKINTDISGPIDLGFSLPIQPDKARIRKI